MKHQRSRRTQGRTADSSVEWRIDILLRVNAEESRAVGVSGSQPRTPPLYGNSFNPVVVVGGCLALTRTEFSFAHQKSSTSEDGAKPPLLLSSVPLTPICCFCQQGVADTSGDSEVSSGLLNRRARDEPFEDSRSPRRHFGYCLIGLAARPPPKAVRNPLRSDLTLPLCSGFSHLNVWIGNPKRATEPLFDRQLSDSSCG